MKQYVVDAFADNVFEGNPAAVCIMNDWIDDDIMQKITIENNLSETAFAVKDGDTYNLRWFTPGGEIDLCGHATLATAYVILRFYEEGKNIVEFDTMSGRLVVTKDGDLYELEFPINNMKKIEVDDHMVEALGVRPLEAWIDRDIVFILDSEKDVVEFTPDLEKLKSLDGLLQHITAKSEKYDCISRSFAPKLSVPEDPVCGSGHCHIAPIWSDKLSKDKLICRQASKRGGTIICKLGENIKMSGRAVLYSEAEIYI